jgi:hypothetical protein
MCPTSLAPRLINHFIEDRECKTSSSFCHFQWEAWNSSNAHGMTWGLLKFDHFLKQSRHQHTLKASTTQKIKQIVQGERLMPI